jgi:hypothetical protein
MKEESSSIHVTQLVIYGAARYRFRLALNFHITAVYTNSSSSIFTDNFNGEGQGQEGLWRGS